MAAKKIKDLPLNIRPQERLFHQGSQNLSDTELIAILLGTGTKKQNALILAARLLRIHPFKKLKMVSFRQFLTIPGIGQTKASRIMAALELGTRLFSPTNLNQTVIKTTKEALQEAQEIADKNQEYLYVLYLNARLQLLQKKLVSLGSLNINLLQPRDVFEAAITSPCASIIIIHNHPSGDPTPSEMDIQFTLKLQKGGEILGINLIDHLIITRSDFFSFKEHA